jgi:hypothetical protein
VAECCECGNEPSGSIKCGEFIFLGGRGVDENTLISWLVSY